MRRLVGVGVGPGDPELVTVKGLRVLRDADVVLVPVADTGETGRAEATVRHHLGDDDRIRRVVFTLGDGGAGRTGRAPGLARTPGHDSGGPDGASAWDRAAHAVREAFDGGATLVAFATIGDPNVYSTFSYLAETVRRLVPGVALETVPGITAMQDLAARSGTVLVEGDEQLLLVPAVHLDAPELAEAMNVRGTVVAYKCGSRMPDVLAALDESGRLEDAVYGAALGLPGEDIRKASQLHPGGHAPYLSTVIAPAARPARGTPP